jgi:hypothetical protein
VEPGLHGQLPGTGQAVARGVVTRRDGEADLVVELGRRRNVAFLLDVESHAERPDVLAATLRSFRPGDNSPFVMCPCADRPSPSPGSPLGAGARRMPQASQFSVTLSSSSNAVLAEWITIDSEAGASLRCWWARPGDRDARAGVLVLPEVFGVNGWVRGVAERLAREGYAALAMPLFARTAPALELTYDEESLRVSDVPTRREPQRPSCWRMWPWRPTGSRPPRGWGARPGLRGILLRRPCGDAGGHLAPGGRQL